MKLALCVRADPDLAYGDDNDPDQPFNTIDAHTFARDYCEVCPVAEACREAGRNERYGTWGGEVRADFATEEDPEGYPEAF